MMARPGAASNPAKGGQRPPWAVAEAGTGIWECSQVEKEEEERVTVTQGGEVVDAPSR